MEAYQPIPNDTWERFGKDLNDWIGGTFAGRFNALVQREVPLPKKKKLVAPKPVRGPMPAALRKAYRAAFADSTFTASVRDRQGKWYLTVVGPDWIGVSAIDKEVSFLLDEAGLPYPFTITSAGPYSATYRINKD